MPHPDPVDAAHQADGDPQRQDTEDQDDRALDPGAPPRRPRVGGSGRGHARWFRRAAPSRHPRRRDMPTNEDLALDPDTPSFDDITLVAAHHR